VVPVSFFIRRSDWLNTEVSGLIPVAVNDLGVAVVTSSTLERAAIRTAE
jgi:hypothetical protein